MAEIESRWPLVAKAGDLKKITATIRGKIPVSPHAQADALDAAAMVAATEARLAIVAVAGNPTPGEERQTVQEVVVSPVQVPDPADRRKKVTVNKQEKVARTVPVPTLSRDYWAAPLA